jgi:hypothetical protein
MRKSVNEGLQLRVIGDRKQCIHFVQANELVGLITGRSD